MTILIMILKIVGIVLLAILGILILLVLAFLFIPVCYKGNAEFRKEESPQLDFIASYLAHLFTFSFSYNNSEVKGIARILFLKKDLLPKHKDEKEKKEQNGNEKRSRKSSKKSGKKKSLSDFLMVIPVMAEELQKEENKQALALLIRQLQYLSRHFGPRKLRGKIRFSLGDPAYTGIALGCISLFPVVYKNDFQISPDFESDQIYGEGKLSFSGRIRAVHAVICFVKLFQNKTIRRLFIKGGSSNVRK